MNSTSNQEKDRKMKEAFDNPFKYPRKSHPITIKCVYCENPITNHKDNCSNPNR